MRNRSSLKQLALSFGLAILGSVSVAYVFLLGAASRERIEWMPEAFFGWQGSSVILLLLAGICVTIGWVWRLHGQLRGRELSLAAERELVEQQRRSAVQIQGLMSASPDPLITVNQLGIIQMASTSVELVLGWDPQQLVGHDAITLFADSNQSEFSKSLKQLAHTEEDNTLGASRECAVRRFDGSEFPATVSLWKMELADCEPQFIVMIRDNTERVEALAKSGRYYEALNASADSISLMDQDTLEVLYVNDAACKALGYQREEMFSQTVLDRISELKIGDRIYAPQEVTQMLAEQGGVDGIELYRHRKDGSKFPVEANIRSFVSEGRRILVTSARDLTEKRKLTAELERLAYTDSLTGLANRSSILKTIQAKLDADSPECFALLFVDFDRFKIVNDSLGHDAGDDLLKQIAVRIRTSLRNTDITPARLGGDEFVILLENLATPDDATIVAERLQEAFTPSYDIGPHEVVSTASIGIVTSQYRYSTASGMLRDADLAMYEAKSAGKACYRVFDHTMRERAELRMKLEEHLHRAIDNNELRIAYQPIVCLSTGELTGAEALLRWQHPEYGLIAPDKFIPIAEESDLIIQIESWVLDHACQQLVSWQKHLGEAAPRCIHVNLSRKQLILPELPERVSRTLQKHQMAPESLHLEVTESMIMEDIEVGITSLKALRKSGVQIDMDDFGTGHSSLSCLHEFPIDVLKVDRAFVANARHVQDYAALLEAVLVLADNLGLNVVAEGIETKEQLALLQGLDCGYGQGYLFAKPLFPEQFEELIRTYSQRPEANFACVAVGD